MYNLPVLKLLVVFKKELWFYAFPGFQFSISIKELTNKIEILIRENIQINAFITNLNMLVTPNKLHATVGGKVAGEESCLPHLMNISL